MDGVGVIAVVESLLKIGTDTFNNNTHVYPLQV
jgi:hypothetical protein